MSKGRSRGQLVRDRRRIANLYLQGWLQVDIAEEVGLGQSTISRDLKALHRDWLRSSLADYDTVKSKELARIDRLEREYWQAWVDSKRDKTATLTEKTGLAPEKGKKAVSKRTRAQVKKEERLGDTKCLQGVQWCIDRRCKILGIDAPQKLEHTWRDEAIKEGFDPDAIYGQLVEEFAAAMVRESSG